MSPETMKRRLLESLLTGVRADLAALERSQTDTRDAATHEESRSEHAKDTRATEQSYLARGLAARVEDLRRSEDILSTLPLRDFEAGEAIALTALVTIEDESSGHAQDWWLLPVAGGIEIDVDLGMPTSERRLRTITPLAPLGQALLGLRVGDSGAFDTPRGPKHFEVLRLI